MPEKHKKLTEKKNLQSRPPVVVVLGHVDHGKTTLLDQIRKSHVAEKESGGITQHIGAYEIACPPSPSVQADGRREKEGPSTGSGQAKKITFIDTPGHEAFSAMRARGAKIADIAILVVAADEGVKPQTKEAISHIKKSGIPMIVAMNKIDKPEANPEKVKRELAAEDVLVESMAGKIPSIGVSAKTGQGIPELLELILLVAEMENLKTDPEKPARGAVIEAYLDAHRGPTATLLLSEGNLKTGNIIATASTFGKIKNLEDFQGKNISKALPAMPVIVLGFEDVPRVGEEFKLFPDLETAQGSLAKREKKVLQVLNIEPDTKVLNIVLKADVYGSLEAIEGILKEIPQEKPSTKTRLGAGLVPHPPPLSEKGRGGAGVLLRILAAEVGEVDESDIKLAREGKARIFSFRVKTNPSAKGLAEREGIKIRNFEIIYELSQAVRELIQRATKPEIKRVDWGKLKTLVLFWAEKNRQIVGGKVIEGEVKKGVTIEVFRNEEKIGKGKLINLQRNKKDIERARKGEECGILYEGDVKIEEGDILAFFTEEREKAETKEP